MFRHDGHTWRSGSEIVDEIGLAPLDLIAEIKRLDNMVNLAYQMAGNFHGNAYVRQSDGTLFPRGPVDDAWEAAGRMLKGTLESQADRYEEYLANKESL